MRGHMCVLFKRGPRAQACGRGVGRFRLHACRVVGKGSIVKSPSNLLLARLYYAMLPSLTTTTTQEALQ